MSGPRGHVVSSASQSRGNVLGDFNNGCGAVPNANMFFQVENPQDLGISIAALFGVEPKTEAMKRGVESQSRRWTMTFPDSKIIAVGEDPIRFPSHIEVFMGISNVCERRSDLFRGNCSHGELIRNYVDGFRDGNNFIVRFDDHSSLFKKIGDPNNPTWEKDRQELDAILDKYREAIRINELAARSSNGQVVILPLGDDQESRLVIPKMLGRLHQISLESGLPGPTYLAKALQVTKACNVYYAESQKIRFITPDQFESLKDLVPDQHLFLEGLKQIKSWIEPAKNTGKIEARFLVVDQKSERPAEAGGDERMLRLVLDDIFETCLSYKDSWQDGIQIIQNEVGALARLQRERTHPRMRRDNVADPEYVRIMYDVLKSGGKKLELGAGFSTPLKAVELGHFDTYEFGGGAVRDFVRVAPDTTYQRITAWALNTFPDLKERRADWLSLCTPEIPLTFDHHPSPFVNAFGDLPEKSFVVLFGRVGTPEKRYVVSSNQYGVSTWRERNTPHVAKLRSEYTDRELTEGVGAFKQEQYFLSHALSAAAGSIYSVDADPFIPIRREDLGEEFYAAGYQDGDLMYRPFYDGNRLDLEHLTSWTREQIEGGLCALGEIAAKNTIKQSPSLDFASLVVSDTDPATGAPKKLLSLSASETFCNSLGIKDTNRYLRAVRTLYSSHAATWIECFINGQHGSSIPEGRREQVRSELAEVFLENYQRTFLTITGPGREQFQEALSTVRGRYQALREDWKERGKTLPWVLDMPKGFSATERLISLSGDEVLDNVGRMRYAIKTHSADFRKIFDIADATDVAFPIDEDYDIAAAVQSKSTINYEVREDALFTAYSLVNNHFSNVHKFAVIDRVLSGKEFDLTPYSLHERIWLFTFIDVVAWLDEIKFPHTKELIQAAETETNVDDFIRVVGKQFRGSNLPQKTLSGFYQAVFGLHNFNEFGDNHPKRSALRFTLLDLQDLLGGRDNFRDTGFEVANDEF